MYCYHYNCTFHIEGHRYIKPRHIKPRNCAPTHQVTSLLKLVQCKSKQSPDVSSLLHDELADVIQRGDLDNRVMVSPDYQHLRLLLTARNYIEI